MTVTGQIPHRFPILSISNALPCVVTTAAANAYVTGQFVRLTNLIGMDELEGNRYKIVILDTVSFQLQDPITFEFIDSRNFPPYVGEGSCNRVPTYFYYHGLETDTNEAEDSDEDQDEDQTQEG